MPVKALSLRYILCHCWRLDTTDRTVTLLTPWFGYEFSDGGNDLFTESRRWGFAFHWKRRMELYPWETIFEKQISDWHYGPTLEETMNAR